MDERFTVSFMYKDSEYNLDAKFVRVGYIHQFHVQLDERTLIFEFDKQREYRVIDTAATPTARNIDAGLIERIVGEIYSLH